MAKRQEDQHNYHEWHFKQQEERSENLIWGKRDKKSQKAKCKLDVVHLPIS